MLQIKCPAEFYEPFSGLAFLPKLGTQFTNVLVLLFCAFIPLKIAAEILQNLSHGHNTFFRARTHFLYEQIRKTGYNGCSLAYFPPFFAVKPDAKQVVVCSVFTQ